MKPKKIAILYASFGNGHKATANAIKNKLEENKDIEVDILDYFEYFNKVINSISINFYKNIGKMPESIYSKIYNSTSNDSLFANFVPEVFKLTGIRLIKYFKDFNPDIVICTHPFATQACAYLKKKNKFNFLLANILTDFEIHRLWYDSPEYIDLFFVSTDEMKSNLVDVGAAKSDQVFVTGIPIKEDFSKSYDKNKIYEHFGLDKNKKTITFFCGGGQGIFYKNVFSMLEIAIKKFKNENLIIISGKNDDAIKKIEKIMQENNCKENVKLHSFISEIPELMYVSDLIISKPGGLTTSETLASGKPMLIISPIPGQEVANTKYLEKNNAGIHLDNLKKAENIFDQILDDSNNLLNDLSENAKRIGHPYATQNIIDIILNKY